MKIIKGLVYTDKQYIEQLEARIREFEEKYDKALTDLAHESHKRIELEEENKRLNFCMQDTYDSANDTCGELQQKIDKAIEYIGNGNIGIPRKTKEKFIKILKGEENESIEYRIGE